MKYIISLNSHILEEKQIKLLENDNIFGVILYGNNILSFDTTKKLISKIKGINQNLKICIDEEGGIVSRIQHFFPNYSQPYCGTIDVKKVKRYYKERSVLLKKLGVDINFAPLVDLATNEDSVVYKRSFGKIPEKIVELAKICIEEQSEVGLESCLKHFPGHGLSTKDSHDELPIVDIDLNAWLKQEGYIYKELLQHINIENIMIGHLKYPKIVDEVTSISSYWINEILRGLFQYKNKIILDDICMKGFPQDTKENSLDQLEINAVVKTG